MAKSRTSSGDTLLINPATETIGTDREKPTSWGSLAAWRDWFASRGAYEPKTAFSAEADFKTFDPAKHIMPFSAKKIAMFLCVAAFCYSEYYFYLFNKPFTKSELTEFVDNPKALEYSAILFCAIDSIMCSLAGANVDGTLRKIPAVIDQIGKAIDRKKPCNTAIIVIGIIALQLSLLIGSSSVASGKPPQNAKEWIITSLLIASQLLLYEVTSLPSVCTGITTILRPRPRKAEETQLLEGQTEGAFDSIALSTLAYSLPDIPAYGQSKHHFYPIMDFIKFFPGFVTRGGASWGVLGYKIPTLFSDDTTETTQYIAAGAAAALGLLMQTMTVAPITYDTSRKKARLDGFTLDQLEKLKALSPDALTDLPPSQAAEIKEMQNSIISAIIRDKKRGSVLAIILNLLPDLTLDSTVVKTTILVNILAAAQYINRTLDFSAFIQHFIGSGPAQKAFAYAFGFFAASQLATQMSMLGVAGAKSLQDNARHLYAKVTKPLFEMILGQPVVLPPCCQSITQ